jgi:hypothetical protein
MRIVFVWVTAVMLCAFVTIGWYVSNTTINAIASSSLESIGVGKGFSLVQLLEWVNIIWGPVLDIVVILWAIANSDHKGAISDYY